MNVCVHISISITCCRAFTPTKPTLWLAKVDVMGTFSLKLSLVNSVKVIFKSVVVDKTEDKHTLYMHLTIIEKPF